MSMLLLLLSIQIELVTIHSTHTNQQFKFLKLTKGRLHGNNVTYFLRM